MLWNRNVANGELAMTERKNSEKTKGASPPRDKETGEKLCRSLQAAQNGVAGKPREVSGATV